MKRTISVETEDLIQQRGNCESILQEVQSGPVFYKSKHWKKEPLLDIDSFTPQFF